MKARIVEQSIEAMTFTPYAYIYVHELVGGVYIWAQD